MRYTLRYDGNLPPTNRLYLDWPAHRQRVLTCYGYMTMNKCLLVRILSLCVLRFLSIATLFSSNALLILLAGHYVEGVRDQCYCIDVGTVINYSVLMMVIEQSACSSIALLRTPPAR